jgi:competence protein ComEC
MGSVSKPALLPAIACVVGHACALVLPILPVGPLGALAGLGVALGGEAGAVVAWGAGGALSAVVRWQSIERARPALDPERPVEVEAIAAGHAERSAFGWSQTLRVLTVRQGSAVFPFAEDVTLALPDDVAPPPLGARVHASGYLRRGSGFADVPSIPASGWRLAVKTRALLRVERPNPAWLTPAVTVRAWLDEALRSASPQRRPGVALASALLVGDTSGIPDAWRRDLRRTGLLHLLAVSGFNVSLLVLAVWLLSAWWPLRVRVAVAATTVALFVLAVGPLPSVLRAGWMTAAFLAALVARRPPGAANALAVAAIVLLVADPRVVADLGFELTFAATAGLIFVAPLLAHRLGGMPGWLAQALAAGWSAQLATLPWAVVSFHQIQPTAFLWNVLFVPLASLAMLVDLAWVLVACAWHGAGRALSFVPQLVAAPFDWLGALPPGPWLVVPIAPRGVPWLLAALVILGLALGGHRRSALGVGVVTLLLGAACWRARPEPPLEAAFLDVGQGDAALLRDGDAAVLIDGGGFVHGDFGGTVLLPALAEAGVRALDAVVMTHGDADHCRGLVDIADYIPVEELWLTRAERDSPCARELLDRRGLRPRFLAEGAHRVLGRWRLDALNPEGDGSRVAGESDNDGSLVLRASAAGRVFLFTGDIERRAEQRLLATYGDGLHAEVLKAPHHGSHSSSTEGFVAAVAPRAAVISAGIGNRFGHPHADVVARYARRGVSILRTDRDGVVVFAWNGARWRMTLPASPR